MKKCFLLSIALLALLFTVAAQAPSNDECSGAKELASYNGFRLNNESTLNATESYENIMYQCPQNDVWYKVVPIRTGTIKIDAYLGGSNYVDIDVFSSASGFICKSTPGGPMPSTYVSGSNELNNISVTAGITYYIRMVREFCGYGAVYFPVIITGNAVALQDNDNCSAARTISYNSTLSNQDNNLSSPSTQFGTQDVPDCNGVGAGFADDDVWFKFTLPAGTNGTMIRVTSTNAKDPVLMLYTNCNISTQPISCANTPGTSESIWKGGLSANTTYYLRVYTWEPRAPGANGGGMNFEVTVKDSTFIANNNCAGSISLGINSTGSFNNINASPSAMPLNPSCSGIVAGTADDDVFFDFTIQSNQAAGTVIRLTTTNGTDPVMMVYRFSDCGQPTAVPIACSNTPGNSETIWAKFPHDPNNIYNDIYFIRIYSWSPDPTPMQFQLTIKDSAFAPNDEPCTAMQLTYNGGAINQTNSGATHTTSVARTANCSTDASNNPLAAGSTGVESDVWYKFTYSPSSGSNGMVVTANSTNSADPVFFLYTGPDCNNLTQVSCSNTAGNERLRLRDITPGAVYYARVHEFFNRTMNFTLQAKDTLFAVNDVCTGATEIPFNTFLTNQNNTNMSGPIFYQTNCSGPNSLAEDDSWFKFTPTGTIATVNIQTTNNTNPVLYVYSVDPSLNCRTGGATIIACSNTGGQTFETLNLTGLTQNKTYFLRVYDQQTNPMYFTMYAGQQAPSANTFTFMGSGNWGDAANWQNNSMPPAVLPSGKEIILGGTGECILNVPQTLSPGSKLTIMPGRTLKVIGDITSQ